jgi:hypothetical protein
MSMRLRTIAASGVLATAVFAGAGSFAVSEDDPQTGSACGEPVANNADRAPRAPGAGIIAPFRRAQRSCDQVASDHGPLLEGDVADAHSARKVALSASQSGHLMPGSDRRPAAVCLLSNGMLSCPSVQHLEDAGASTERAWRGDEVRLQGVVVDGVRTIEIAFADGSSSKLSVRENTYVWSGRRWPVQARWRTPDGQEHLHRYPPR